MRIVTTLSSERVTPKVLERNKHEGGRRAALQCSNHDESSLS